MQRSALIVVVSVLAVASVVDLYGQSPAPATPNASPSPPPCSSAEHRQFDFWLGDWNVRDPQGTLLGTNLITSEFGGCVLHEHWAGGSMTGASFNIYRVGTKQWHQSWVDSNGTLLLLDGEFKDGKMTLLGEGKRAGRPIQHRISWEPLPGGKVRQLWETSNDSGKTWAVAFDGRYERKTG